MMIQHNNLLPSKRNPPFPHQPLHLAIPPLYPRITRGPDRLRDLLPPRRPHNLIAKPDQIPLIRMRRAIKSLQPRQPLIPQPILGQHATNGPPENLAAAVLLDEHVHGDGPQRTGARVVSVVRLLPLLSARSVESRAVRHDYVVAAVGRGVPHGLVLAHEEDGDAACEAAEGWGGRAVFGGEGWVEGFGGDVVPYSGVGELCLD